MTSKKRPAHIHPRPSSTSAKATESMLIAPGSNLTREEAPGSRRSTASGRQYNVGRGAAALRALGAACLENPEAFRQPPLRAPVAQWIEHLASDQPEAVASCFSAYSRRSEARNAVLAPCGEPLRSVFS